jgi:hypothetical protein
MTREVKWKDPNCYNEAVLFYRETFNLQMNAGFRRDVAVTVKTYDDLLIWQDLVSHWGYWKDGKWHKRNPLDLKGLLTVFEFKQREAQKKKDEIQQKGGGIYSEKGIPERPARVLPEQRMPLLLERQNGWK